MKNNVRRGLFHPDDIKIIGLSNIAPGPLSAPIPSLSRKSSRPSISPLGSFGPSSASSYSHSRSGSLATPLGSTGSFGQAEAKKLQNQTEFGKYTEDDEEDYEDVFGKPNATCKLVGRMCLFWGMSDRQLCCSYGTSHADSTTKYTAVEQVVGKSICPPLFIEEFTPFLFLAW